MQGKKSILSNYDFASRNRVVGRGSGGDLTLKIDKLSEQAILKSLLKDLAGYPFTFFSEEMGEARSPGGERAVIICDPLDGSHNARVGIPLFSISLAVIEPIKSNFKRLFSDVAVSFVQSIPSDDEYYAIKKAGAFHNYRKINPERNVIASLEFNTLGVECGDVAYLKDMISNLTSRQAHKFRVLGSAAMALCLLAEGALDGFVFAQPKGARSIDSAAAYLIAREAGIGFADLSGKLKDVDETEISFESRINLAGARTPRMLGHLLNLLNRTKVKSTRE